MRRRRFKRLQTCKRGGEACILRFEEGLPAIRVACRAQHFAHELEPRAPLDIGLAALHVPDIVARRAKLVEQLSHAGLRMLRMLREARPAFLVERQVEAGQHHGAVRQRGDDLEQPRRGRHRSGRSCRDHRPRRRVGHEPRRLEFHQPIPPRGRRDEPVVAEIGRPMLGDDLEKVDRLRPMLGVLLWREILREPQDRPPRSR